MSRRIDDIQAVVARAVSSSLQAKQALEIEVVALRGVAAAGASEVEQREQVRSGDSLRRVLGWVVSMGRPALWSRCLMPQRSRQRDVIGCVSGCGNVGCVHARACVFDCANVSVKSCLCVCVCPGACW